MRRDVCRCLVCHYSGHFLFSAFESLVLSFFSGQSSLKDSG